MPDINDVRSETTDAKLYRGLIEAEKRAQRAEAEVKRLREEKRAEYQRGYRDGTVAMHRAICASADTGVPPPSDITAQER